MLRSIVVSGVFLMLHCQVGYTQWFRATGLTSNTVKQIVSVSGMHFAVTSSAGIFRSTDNGRNWVAANNGLNNFVIHNLRAHGDVLFVGVGIYQGGDIYRSTNLGENWTRVPLNGVSPHPAVYSFASRSNYVFASTEAAGVFRTSNLGGTWIAASIGLPGTTYIGAMLGIEGRVLANDGGSMYETTDDGVSWHSAPLTSAIRQFLLQGTTIYAANLNGWLTGGGGVRRSEDFCRTWTLLGLQDTSVHSIALRGRDLFASTNDGVFKRDLNNPAWENVSFGLLNRTTYALAISDSFLIAGTLFEGVWLRPLHEIVSTALERGDAKPHDFILHQNYPNPFNPATTIEFALPKSVRATLKVFDLLGREVATLVDEKLPVGVHKAEWNAGGLASGVYLYQLKAGEFLETKRLLLLR